MSYPERTNTTTPDTTTPNTRSSDIKSMHSQNITIQNIGSHSINKKRQASHKHGLEIQQLNVQLEQLTLSYNLSVTTGEILAIQGTSGVGKTTLLNTIAGFQHAKSGTLLWQGSELLGLPADKRPVSMLFQEYNLFEHISVLDNLTLGFTGQTPKQALMAAAEHLGLADQISKMPTELSGGQRQRVGLIRTLLRPEPIILLDEPFAELDQNTRLQAAQWTREVAKQQGKTLLLVTHQQEDVEVVADSTLVLQQSKSAD